MDIAAQIVLRFLHEGDQRVEQPVIGLGALFDAFFCFFQLIHEVIVESRVEFATAQSGERADIFDDGFGLVDHFETKRKANLRESRDDAGGVGITDVEEADAIFADCILEVVKIGEDIIVNDGDMIRQVEHVLQVGNFDGSEQSIHLFLCPDRGDLHSVKLTKLKKQTLTTTRAGLTTDVLISVFK